MSSLAGFAAHLHNPGVDEPAQAPVELPLRPQDEVECRRCEVHCDKVVYPGACLERSCPFVYAYEAWGHTYMGCMQKVYAVEIDLDLLEAAERGGGFGAVRAVRQPLPMCETGVESTYAGRTNDLGCVNPEFFELPQGSPSFRVIARIDAD
jgi:hypothetical protein